MCERLAALALCLFLTAGIAVGAEPQVTILDLPFKATAMRGPGTEVALAVSTSGLVPKTKTASRTADPRAVAAEPEPAPVAVVWGDDGAAALTLADGSVRVTLLARDTIDSLVKSETPRGAVPGSHRALAGPISAYLTGPARSATGASGQAAGLTIRERQPLGVTADPKPVPVATQTVATGADTLFAARRPHVATLDGKPVIIAVTTQEKPGGSETTSSIAVLGKDGRGQWSITGRTPPQSGDGRDTPLTVAAVADFAGTGRAQVAAVRSPEGPGVLQLWTFSADAAALTQEAPGYAGAGSGDDVDLAAAIRSPKGASILALPVADRTALAFLSFKDGIKEDGRLPLPAPAAFGIAALGIGTEARILVGLADGRVALVPAPVQAP